MNKMTILIVEDQEDSLDNVKEKLTDNEYNVLCAEDLYAAKKFFGDHYHSINAIVTDLNMHPCFIARDEQRLQEASGASYAGWVWLKYCVFKKHPAFVSKTALRSAYIGDLETYLKYNDEEEKELLKTVKKIERKNDFFCEETLPWLRELEHNIRKPSKRRIRSRILKK